MFIDLNVMPDIVGVGTDFEPIYRAIHWPGVTALNISHFLSPTDTPEEEMLNAPTGTSTLEALRFTYCGFPTPETAHLLAWPAKLRVLQVLCIQYNLMSTSYVGDHTTCWDGSRFRMTGLLAALAPQKTNLEHLYVTIEYDEHEFSWDAQPDFHDFTALKTLHLPADAIWDDVSPTPRYATRSRVKPLVELLPDSLEELVFDCQSMQIEWCNVPKEFPWKTECSTLLLGWLMDVCRAKKASASNLPSLRRIRFRIKAARWPGDRPSRRPGDCQHVRDLVQAYAECGMTLDWTYTCHDLPDIAEM